MYFFIIYIQNLHYNVSYTVKKPQSIPTNWKVFDPIERCLMVMVSSLWGLPYCSELKPLLCIQRINGALFQNHWSIHPHEWHTLFTLTKITTYLDIVSICKRCYSCRRKNQLLDTIVRYWWAILNMQSINVFSPRWKWPFTWSTSRTSKSALQVDKKKKVNNHPDRIR